jgi:hypothetical protein
MTGDHTWSFTVASSTNSPPTPTISTPTAGTNWAVGDVVSFSGSATDAQDGTLAPARLTWELIMHHCGGSGCHTHPIQTFAGVASGSFTAPDHEYPSHLELRVTATDSGGLTATASRQLDPRTVDLSFATSPSGLSLVVGSSTAPAPFTRTVIVGSQNAVSAPSPQSLSGQQYTFVSWSNGSPQSHTITAPATNATYTASFTAAGSSPPTTRYLSDLAWTSSTNGWGPVERDQSNGEAGAGDGNPPTLQGQVFVKALGVHALSEVVVPLGGTCTRFRATVGVDDEVGSLGSVTFQVHADGIALWESPVLGGSSAPLPVEVDITGRSSLRLVVTNGGDDIDFDHADWAEARIECSQTAPPPDTTPPTVTASTPAAGATGVAASVRPTATFSETMTAGSIGTGTFTLRKAGSSADVAATVAYNAATRVATLTPSVTLDAGGSYTARVVGGPSGVKDAAGNPLAADHTWSFTVASGPARAFPASVVVESGTYTSGSAASLLANDGNHHVVSSTRSGTRTTSWYGVIGGVPNALSSLAVTYRGSNSATCTQTISIWRWTTSSWVTLNTSSIGVSETSRTNLVPTGPAADYVSGTSGSGDVRVRVRCTRTTNFSSRGEEMFVDVVAP